MQSPDATNQCVKCGLCLPHCPTFILTGNEADSPRGRISLMQSLSQNAQTSPGLFMHLDSCLQCRACEAMCPSRVPFGALMDTARRELEVRRRRSFVARLARRTGLKLLTPGPRLESGLVLLLRVLRNSGLSKLLRRTGLLPLPLQRLNRLLVRSPRRFRFPGSPASSAGKDPVQLFRGCVTGVMDAEALESAVLLLRRSGYPVRMPEKQTCCGALHQHIGEVDSARQLAAYNARAFGMQANQPIVSLASGCTAQLREYAGLYPETVAEAFTPRVVDIHRFLVEDPAFNSLRFRPLPGPVAVQIPCSQRHVLKEPDSITRLLEKIPGVSLVQLNPGGGCCGAAGSYCLTQPGMADQLATHMLAGLSKNPPAYLVSSNIGCALHLSASMQAFGWDTEVLHPLSLLARQLYNGAHTGYT